MAIDTGISDLPNLASKFALPKPRALRLRQVQPDIILHNTQALVHSLEHLVLAFEPENGPGQRGPDVVKRDLVILRKLIQRLNMLASAPNRADAPAILLRAMSEAFDDLRRLRIRLQSQHRASIIRILARRTHDDAAASEYVSPEILHEFMMQLKLKYQELCVAWTVSQ